MSETLAKNLLTWFDDHGRNDLPWQLDITPYRVWVSEIMLQQTQVSTVIPYYQRFMTEFPDVQSLARANIDDVLHLWTGLGYYARARNLHRAAAIVTDQYSGEFPATVDELVNLPGIGRSTAGAIVSIACKGRAPILDGNVKRVLARYHAVPGWPGRSAVMNSLWELAELHTPDTRVAAYTQAIMDLGATVCRRSRPACEGCPLSARCEARAAGNPADYPGKKPRKTLPERSTVFLLARSPSGEWLLEQRPPSGIWGGLWCFPELPSAQSSVDWCLDQLQTETDGGKLLPSFRHTFSHYHLHIQPVVVQLAQTTHSIMAGDRRLWYNPLSPARVGLAAPVARLLNDPDLIA